MRMTAASLTTRSHRPRMVLLLCAVVVFCGVMTRPPQGLCIVPVEAFHARLSPSSWGDYYHHNAPQNARALKQRRRRQEYDQDVFPLSGIATPLSQQQPHVLYPYRSSRHGSSRRSTAVAAAAASQTRLFAQENQQDDDIYGNIPDDEDEDVDKEEITTKDESSLFRLSLASSLRNRHSSASADPTSTTTATSMTTKPTSMDGSNNKRVNGATYEPAPNVRNSLLPLYQLTRPSSNPGIVVFHMVGVYLALKRTNQASMFWNILIYQPTMWVTLLALMLTSATSMVINDYYDAKLGRDQAKVKHKALVDGTIPLLVAKRFLNYLYAAALLCVAFLPGVPTRLSVLVGLIMTFYYTQHLKPITWLKNIICASLIALSPVTSASAALHLTSHKILTWQHLWIGPLWRLVTTLFFGVLAREIIMDMNDMTADEKAGILTVPVMYGKRFASRAAWILSVVAGVVGLWGPGLEFFTSTSWTSSPSLWQSLKGMAPTVLRRLFLASMGSFFVIRGGWDVYQNEGNNTEINDRVVEEGLVTVLFFLASCV